MIYWKGILNGVKRIKEIAPGHHMYYEVLYKVEKINNVRKLVISKKLRVNVMNIAHEYTWRKLGYK